MRFYHNIEHVMAHIDAEAVLKVLGFRYARRKGDLIVGWCPDHFAFTGHFPSHPKWYLNVKTGKTYCFTESRGSNIVYVTARALNVSLKEAFDLITQDMQAMPSRLKLAIDQRASNETGATPEKVETEGLNVTLESIKTLLSEGYLSKRAIDYFAKDGIRAETVRSFKIVEVTRGRYRDRVIIPFFHHETFELNGFVAVDLLGKRQWVRGRLRTWIDKQDHKPLFSELKDTIEKLRDGYRKTLYCPGTHTGLHLFGFERLIGRTGFASVIIVEGERDAIKLQQEGFNAVGTHGTHLTVDQQKMLRENGITQLIIAYDGNPPGWKAGEKVLKECGNMFNTTMLWLPEDKDPKHYDREGFKQLLNEYQPTTKEDTSTPKLTRYGERMRERSKTWLSK